eukprot:1678541-Amphidinium_carterae.2
MDEVCSNSTRTLQKGKAQECSTRQEWHRNWEFECSAPFQLRSCSSILATSRIHQSSMQLCFFSMSLLTAPGRMCSSATTAGDAKLRKDVPHTIDMGVNPAKVNNTAKSSKLLQHK